MDIPIHPMHKTEIESDPEKLDELINCATSFVHFLKYWKYLSQETGEVLTLGDGLWESQEQFAEAMVSCDKVFILKARKLGATTIGAAFDAWVARFRDRNARVHLYSRRQDAAEELLASVKYGLDRLPKWMRLPYLTDNKLELKLKAGPDDTRHVKAYPTSAETSVEATCGHAHVDELARMIGPEAVWQSVEPSIAGTAHIITTGRGPTNYASVKWRSAIAGDDEYVPIFVDALARPGRTESWYRAKSKQLTKQSMRQEYPMTDQDAMAGGGTFLFAAETVAAADRGEGSQPAEPGCKYMKAWDIGRHQDAAVGIVINMDATPLEVVHYRRLRGVPYPMTQKFIEQIHAAYPGPTKIEQNGPGEAVAENLNFRQDDRTGWAVVPTTGKSKPRMLEALQLALEQLGIIWSEDEWPQLAAEIRGYQIPDDAIVQDSVMTLAIAIDNAGSRASRPGRVRKPVLA